MTYDLFVKRYELARSRSNLTEQAIAKKAGVSRDTLRNFTRRGVPPKDLISVAKVAKALNVNPFYFLEPLGLDGNILSGPINQDISVNVTNDPNEIALLSLFRDLDDAQKSIAFQMMSVALTNQRTA